MPSRNLVTFAGRAAVAATLGLLCSLLLGLHEPHWAAWTVVSVGIGIRGDSILKSINRAIGTAVGAAVGILLVFAAQGSDALLVGLLAVWLALCVYAGLSLRNFRAYAAVLAGYTAVILAMSVTGEAGHLFELARDRCTGVLIGLASALVVLLPSSAVQSGQPTRRIRHAIVAACAWSADRLAGLPRARTADGASPQRLGPQLREILALDGAIYSAAAESPALWARASRLRGVVPALLDMLVVSRGVERNFEEATAGNSVANGEIAAAVAQTSELLTTVARALRDDLADESDEFPVFRQRVQALRGALGSIPASNVLERRRIDLVSALLAATEASLQTYAALTGKRENGDTKSYPAPAYALDRNNAVAAALRAGFAFVLAGGIWIATDWQGGPLFVAFTSIAIALFAIRPDPRHTGIHFLGSGAVGAAAAVLFYVTVVPHMPHAAAIALAEGSIVFMAIALSSLLSNLFWASGFCLVFLVVSDPEAIAYTTASVVSEHALGVLAGSALAALAFHLVPSRGFENRWRKQPLKQIADTLGTLIASPLERQTIDSHHAWQTRSIDALVRIALPAASGREVDEGMLWTEIGVELLKLQEVSRGDIALLAPDASRTAERLLADLGNLETRAWHARLIAASAELHDETLVADQKALAIQARILELASLLKRVAAARIAPAAQCTQRA
jgi:uncharacterized membrane protein YccC